MLAEEEVELVAPPEWLAFAKACGISRRISIVSN